MIFSGRDNEDRPYSIIGADEKSTNKQSKNLSDDENNFDLATTTPLDTSGHLQREKFFSNTDKSSNPYSLVGAELSQSPIKSKQSIKQKRTSKRNSAPISPTESNTYSEVGPASPVSFTRPMKPCPFQSSQPLGRSTDKLVQSYSIRGSHAESVDSLYQIPIRNSFPGRGVDSPQHLGSTEDNIYQAMPSSLPATTMHSQHHQQRQSNDDNIYQSPPTMKQRSHTLPLQNHTITATAQENYDNVNLQNKRTVSSNTNADVYDNVQLSNSPVNTGDMYDNVHITNKQQQQQQQQFTNSPPNSNDMYYQQPPSLISGGSIGVNENADMYYQAPATMFKPKSNAGIKQNSSSQQQYTSVKTKSMKQKRTGTIKRDISIDDNIDSSVIVKPKDEQLIKTHEDTVDNTSDVLDIKNNMNLNLNAVSGDTASLEVVDKSEETGENDEETPIPKPRTKVKQSRTIDRSVESGYRMSEIEKKQPLDETYEWNKVRSKLISNCV